MKTEFPANNSSSSVTVQLVSNSGLLVLFIAWVIGVWNNVTPVVILLSIFFMAIGIAKLWSRYSLTNIHYERLLGEYRTFPGEKVQLTLKVSNNKLLPLAWLEINDNLPTELTIINTENSKPLKSSLVTSIALSGYKRAIWHYQINCSKRGYYTFGPASLHSGDIFGFYPRCTVSPGIDHLIVYPRIFPITKFAPRPKQPLGDLKAIYRIFHDPTRPIGIREYAPGDPFNHIYWKATARHQQLQVKEFEPSTTLQSIIWLAVDSFNYADDADSSDYFEWAISTVASIAYYLTENNFPLGLFANTCLSQGRSYIKTLPGTSLDHMTNILEVLARITLKPLVPIEDMINEEKVALPWGSTLIFVASEVSEKLSAILDDLQKSRHQVILLQIGEMPLQANHHSYSVYKINTFGDIVQPEASLSLEKVT
jgi:uncharacterized protein (DUF58 family)